VKGRPLRTACHILQTPAGSPIAPSDANPDATPGLIVFRAKRRVSFSVSPVAGSILFYAHTRELRRVDLPGSSALVSNAAPRSGKEAIAPLGA